MTTELFRDGHWKVSDQSGNNMATLWNAWERTRAVFQRLLSGWSSGAEGTLIPRWLEENPEKEEELLPQLAHDSKQTKPWCCSTCSLCGAYLCLCGNAHEPCVLWTCVVGSGNSNHWILLGLHYYMLTLEMLSSQSCSLTRHLLDCLQGLLEISCVLYFFNKVLISLYICSYLQWIDLWWQKFCFAAKT